MIAENINSFDNLFGYKFSPVNLRKPDLPGLKEQEIFQDETALKTDPQAKTGEAFLPASPVNHKSVTIL